MRELIAQVQQAGAVAQAAQPGAMVRDSHLDATAGMSTGQHRALVPHRPMDETQPARPSAKHDRETVHAALSSNDWNIAAAQRALAIPNRTTLVRLMEKFGLSRPE